ncbi:MAG: hypothetical protein A3G87_03455 [Omnitrophica bacterium RIFCSPLOWO2_12_FULL_50_11]|nr:MAG: hypothetical protein A3G87_03455 [Omnitrophica bacterium RIFCSPLOWO2_12_FULL_50_11]
MNDDDFIELHRGEDDSFEFAEGSVRPIQPWKAKLIIWSTIVGGIAVGTALFLFFLTLFIYFFVPIVVLAAIWALVRNLGGHR